MDDLRDNPHALEDAPSPGTHFAAVGDTTLYAEVRGEGPPVLIIPGGAEDAEGWRPVAERLDGCTVVTYDRCGTLRSGREDWPGGGANQHADDAAGLLDALGLHHAIVFGASSGGVVAVQLAIRHPASVRRVLAYEPGFLRSVPAGRESRANLSAAIDAYLEQHPGDWSGAYGEFAHASAPNASSASTAFVADAEAFEWHARREAGNAEPFIRDDVPLITAEDVDVGAIRSTPIEIRFSYGSRSGSLFRDIATFLASARGETPDVIEGAGHALYLAPELAATYMREHVGRSTR